MLAARMESVMRARRMIAFFLLASVILFSLSASNATAQKTVNVTGLEVAQQAMSFIEGMRNPDGSFNYSKVCTEKGCTFIGDTNPQTHAWVALAYAGLYNATGDQQYLSKMRVEMERLLVACPPENPRCYWVGVQAAEAYKLTGDRRYLEYITNLDSYLWREDDVGNMLNGILAREMALAYEYGVSPNQSRYLPGETYLWEIYSILVRADRKIKSDMSASESNLMYTTDRGFNVGRAACWVHLSQLEYYRALGSNESAVVRPKVNMSAYRRDLLKYSAQFFDGVGVKNTLDGGIPFDFIKTTLTEHWPCVESLLMLGEFTGEERYLSDALALEQVILDYWWDSSISPKFDGDGGFNSQGCLKSGGNESVTCFNNMKVLDNNAYAVYLFAKQKDRVFTIKGSVNVTHQSKPTFTLKPPTTTVQPPKEEKPGGVPAVYYVIAVLVIVAAYLAHTQERKK